MNSYVRDVMTMKNFLVVENNKYMKGIYKFEITKDGNQYLAECFMNDERIGMTCGEDENEIFDMVADFYKTSLDIEISWYRYIIYKIFRV